MKTLKPKPEQVILSLVVELPKDCGYNREEMAEAKREIRFLRRLGKSDMIAVVRRGRVRKLSTGVKVQSLILEAIEMMN